MDKKSILDDIFSNDPFGLLDIKPKVSQSRNEEERLISSFEEINSFYEKEQREPQESQNMQERTLFSRLSALRKNHSKTLALKPYDRFGLLNILPQKEYNSLDDLLQDDLLGLLSDDSEGLFDLKHVNYNEDRASAEFVARRKPCKDFEQFEPILQAVQKDLSLGKRKLVNFNQDNLRVGAFYVHNGILFYLKEINITQKEHYKPDGTRVREDGRTRCIFENGTESNMLKRSVEKILYANGKVVTENSDDVATSLSNQGNEINENDQAFGYIYVLRSKSTDPAIKNLKDLYKIGYSSVEISDRLKNASKEPTYLMAEVKLVMSFKCYNMNPQKLEMLLHNFFGSACLDIDIFDEKGQRHTPREWFIAPLNIIEEAVELVLNGKIINYKYEPLDRKISQNYY
ncbi:MAG: GIY-YIG nuclease family protein [Cytophagaceae bacterium]|nr:GIY-YIG nuclease family protein [Cytophagaceae bacterium]MBL0302673.1 GIY-YIG nuclease family protein [Cytophagaceae bacterium]MBL0325497.1 GIY-YIG nuclease family protein [Cytophagaceae bacterium]